MAGLADSGYKPHYTRETLAGVIPVDSTYRGVTVVSANQIPVCGIVKLITGENMARPDGSLKVELITDPADIGKAFGIVARLQQYEALFNTNGDAVYAEGYPMRVLTMGTLPVYTEGAITVNDAVNARLVANGGNDKAGYGYTATADGVNTAVVPNARWLANASEAGVYSISFDFMRAVS